MYETDSTDESKSGQDQSNEVTNMLDKGQVATYAKIVDWAKQNFRKCKDARVQQEKQWYLNLAFYYGKQYVQPARGTTAIQGSAGLITPPAPYYVQRPTINRIRPTIRTELAKLTSNKPNAFIIPATSEDRDLFAAQAGEQVWDSTYRKYEIDTVLRQAVFWTLTCGTGFIKSYWDPTAHDIDQDQGMGISGDFGFQAETPFHIFVADQKQEDIEKQPFVIHAQEKPIDQLRMMYPDYKLNVRTTVQDEIMDTAAYAPDTHQAGANPIQKALVLECWVKPGAVPLFPQGAMFTIIGEQIVQGQMGWPYSHGKYPFAKIDHIPSGRFYGDSVIVDLIPLQKEYNRTRGQILEAKNRMAKPQLAAEQGSIDPKKVTTEPGQIIMYQPGFNAPTPIPMQELPSYVIHELDRILTDWSDISGMHEVSNGQAPSGVTSATGISYLQEQDETKLSHTVHSIEKAIEKVANQTLSYVVDYWDMPRIVKTVGTSGAFDALSLKGSQLKGNTDLKVEAGSALPVSRAAKQALIMDMMKLGFVRPEDGLELMEMGGINKLYDRLQVDTKQAQRENLKMSKVTMPMIMQHAQGENQKAQQDPNAILDEEGRPVDEMGIPIPPKLIVDVNTWDDHARHVIHHNNYRKSQDFEQLSEESKALFDEHVNRHLVMLGMMDQGVLQSQGGLPPEEGGAPAPGSPEEAAAGGPSPEEPMAEDIAPEGAPQ